MIMISVLVFFSCCFLLFFVVVVVFRGACLLVVTHWDTADAEIKVPYVENTELANGFSLKPGVGQNLATYASLTAKSFFLVRISTFPI